MIVRRTAALAVAASALAIFPAAQAGARPATAGMSNFDKQLVSYVNSARIQRGIEPLELSAALNPIAQQWSQQMAQTENDSDNPQLRSEINAACPSWRLLGENVGHGGESTAQDLFNVYMKSSGERQEMLNPRFTDVAVSSTITNNDGSPEVWNVMDFANHCS